MTIREAGSADIPTIIEFQMRMAIETENMRLDEKVLTSGIRNLFKDRSKGKYYVAEENGEVMGCLMTTFEWSDWRDGTVLWIQSVYIAEKFRGKGIFRKLFGHIRSLATSDAGIKGIRLYVDKTNSSAQRVYEKLGMNGDHYQVYESMNT